MSTDTKKLERVLLEEVFINDRTSDYEEIKEKGKSVLGENYSDGKVSGLINKMVKNGTITRVDRGKYRLTEGYKFDVKSVAKTILKNAVNEINENLSKVDITALDDKEFEDIRDIRKLMKVLEEFIK